MKHNELSIDTLTLIMSMKNMAVTIPVQTDVFILQFQRFGACETHGSQGSFLSSVAGQFSYELFWCIPIDIEPQLFLWTTLIICT